MLSYAGVTDCFSCSCGHTRTKGNFMKATLNALKHTYEYLTPDLWKPTHFVKTPYQESCVDGKENIVACLKNTFNISFLSDSAAYVWPSVIVTSMDMWQKRFFSRYDGGGERATP